MPESREKHPTTAIEAIRTVLVVAIVFSFLGYCIHVLA